MRRAQVGEDIPVVGGDNVKMEKTGTSLTDGRVSIKVFGTVSDITVNGGGKAKIKADADAARLGDEVAALVDDGLDVLYPSPSDSAALISTLLT